MISQLLTPMDVLQSFLKNFYFYLFFNPCPTFETVVSSMEILFCPSFQYVTLNWFLLRFIFFSLLFFEFAPQGLSPNWMLFLPHIIPHYDIITFKIYLSPNLWSYLSSHVTKIYFCFLNSHHLKKIFLNKINSSFLLNTLLFNILHVSCWGCLLRSY